MRPHTINPGDRILVESMPFALKNPSVNPGRFIYCRAGDTIELCGKVWVEPEPGQGCKATYVMPDSIVKVLGEDEVFNVAPKIVSWMEDRTDRRDRNNTRRRERRQPKAMQAARQDYEAEEVAA